MPEHRERAFGAGQDYVQTSGGIYVPPWSEAAEPPVVEAPIGVDLFAGAGGFSCGFHQAGWHVAAASEWWPIAVETYLCNLGGPDTLVYVGETAAPDATKKERRIFEARGGEFVTAAEFFELLPLPKEQSALGPGTGWIAREPRDHERGSCFAHIPYEDPDGAGKACDNEHGDLAHRLPCEVFFCCDVRELTGDFIHEALGLEQGDVGCVFGGPPCQGFSVAGKQDPNDPRSQLVFEFARVVCEVKPQAFCMENVPGIINMVTPQGVPVLDALALVFEQGGMGVYDALRKSLMSTAGLGAAIKGTHKRGRVKAEDVDELDVVDEETQLELEIA